MVIKKRLHPSKGSFLLVLPRSWVEQSGLSHGDRVVEIFEDGGCLVVRPSKHRLAPPPFRPPANSGGE